MAMPLGARDPGLPPADRTRLVMILGAAAVFLIAFVVVGLVVRPFSAGPVASDAAASVLYWNRIAGGDRLEAFVNTTPKPLLTLVYGLAWNVTGDWRSISVLAIAVEAACAMLAALLAWRLAGIVAGIIAAVVVVADGRMLAEVSWAYGLPWALGFLAAAGLAVTAEPRRYGFAGLMLLLGCLVRQETFLVLGLATMALGWALWRRRVPPRAALILVGWLALPVMLVHDALLAGDPLYWLRVSSVYATGIEVRPVGQVVDRLLSIVVGYPLLALMAAIGLVGLLWSRSGRVVAIGLVALGAGTAVLVLAVAIMERQTLGHYYSPIWSSLAFAAALGVGFLVRLIGQRLRNRSTIERIGAQVAVAVVGGVVVIGSLVVSDRTLHEIANQRRIAIDSDAAATTLGTLVPSMNADVPAVGPLQRPAGSTYQLLVPRPLMYRLAVDLGVPLTVLGPLLPDRPTPGLIHPGVVVFHDELADGSSKAARQFEGAGPVVVEGATFDLVANDPPRTWIWQAR